MSRKLVANATVLNQAVSADVNSSVTSIEYLDNVSYQIAWTGTLAATLAVQVSNDYDSIKQSGTFYPITVSGLTAPAGTPGGYVVNMNQLPYKYIRLSVDYTSGTGTMSCVVNAKSVGA